MSVGNLSEKEFIEEYKELRHCTDFDGCLDKLGLSIFFLFVSLYFSIIVCFFVMGICEIFGFPSFFGILAGIVSLISLFILYIICEFKDRKEKIAKKRILLEKTNLSEDECNKIYDEFRKVKNHLTYFSIIQQVCRLNPNASYSQEDLLKGLFGFDDATIKKYVFEKEYTEEDLKFYGEHAKAMDLKERKSFVDLLFKLAIVLDGIHNDEWKLLMQILEDFKFNKNYINLFIRRYGPLRTEFEDERKDSTSTGERTVALLNPYYAILGLDNSATEEEIKKAYHALALEHHPDLPKNAGRIQECEEMMAKINEAYEKIKG